MNKFKFDAINFDNRIRLTLEYQGKVRDIYNVRNEVENKDFILFLTSNRCSAFNYNICSINNKGYFLTKISSYWFKHTRNIIDNMYILVYRDLHI